MEEEVRVERLAVLRADDRLLVPGALRDLLDDPRAEVRVRLQGRVDRVDPVGEQVQVELAEVDGVLQEVAEVVGVLHRASPVAMVGEAVTGMSVPVVYAWVRSR